jgi:hypothetical protein
MAIIFAQAKARIRPNVRSESAADTMSGEWRKVSQNRILRAVLRGMDVLPPATDKLLSVANSRSESGDLSLQTYNMWQA